MNEYIVKYRQEAFNGELKKRIDDAFESDLFIIKRFVMIEKSGLKGTYPCSHQKNCESFQLLMYRNFKTQLSGHLLYGFDNIGTGNLESLDETVDYYEDIEKALKNLNGI